MRFRIRRWIFSQRSFASLRGRRPSVASNAAVSAGDTSKKPIFLRQVQKRAGIGEAPSSSARATAEIARWMPVTLPTKRSSAVRSYQSVGDCETR